jgi:ribosomal protein S12 methylthiotransferase accessory factor
MKKTIEVNFPGGKRVEAKIGNTIIPTDQPIKDGGEGKDPEPFQLFLASLAACSGIYALNFCQSRGISTKEMELTMACEFDPEEKRYKKMTINLKLPKGFPEKYKNSIIKAMDLCAVTKHILNPPQFEIKAR